MATIPFTKVVGSGNDFVLVDARNRRVKLPSKQWPSIAQAWCDRHKGVGADGVLVLGPSKKADVAMRIFNADGSEAEMCGNGARCVVVYVDQARRGKKGHVTLQTLAGVLSAKVRGNQVAMRMTNSTDLRPYFTLNVEGQSLKMGFVNTGVPHAVVPVEGLETVDVEYLGRTLRNHAHFAPKGTNVNFIQADPKDADHITVRTYERGVESETLACGTGVAAAAILHAVGSFDANAHKKITRKIKVSVRSGDCLRVSLDLNSSGNKIIVSNVVLEGPARRVFDGVAQWPPGRFE